jgi:hypothetical protein
LALWIKRLTNRISKIIEAQFEAETQSFQILVPAEWFSRQKGRNMHRYLKAPASMRKTWALVAVLGFAPGLASAAMVASDNGGNYISSGGWGTSAPNDGSGFGPWASFVTNNTSPPYAGTYLDLTSYNNSPNIEAYGGGADWGTYANSGPPAPAMDLVRPFLPAAGGYSDPSTLGTLYNQTFSVALASGGVGNAGAAIGFSLDIGQGAGAVTTPALTLEYAGGGPDSLTLIDNNGTDNTAVPIDFSNLNGGILVSVAVGSNPDGLNPYSVTISPLPGNSTFSTPVVLTGSENGPLQQVDMFTDNTTNDGFFNSLSITAEAAVPEPASIGLVSAAALMLGARRRRKA